MTAGIWSGCQHRCLPVSMAGPVPVQGWQGAAGELPARAESSTWEQLLAFHPRIEASGTTTALASLLPVPAALPCAGHPSSAHLAGSHPLLGTAETRFKGSKCRRGSWRKSAAWSPELRCPWAPPGLRGGDVSDLPLSRSSSASLTPCHKKESSFPVELC